MVVLLSIRKTGFYSANGNNAPFVDSRWQFICSYVDDK
jgi:hypothetical protein